MTNNQYPTLVTNYEFKVGNSYLETYGAGFALFTILDHDEQTESFFCEDYYDSEEDHLSSYWADITDFCDSTYLLPSKLSADELKSLYPELLI